MAIIAKFSQSWGSLVALGDALDNAIEVSRSPTGQLLINGGGVRITGGTPTIANTSYIQLIGQAGNDVLTANETNGALPPIALIGGDGNDILTGGSGADSLRGDAGNDNLSGRGGADTLRGGAGNDTLTGGDGDDQVFGEGGNDRMVWNPGDDTDLFEGGDGVDTAEVNGGNGAEVFTVTANGDRVRFDRITPAPFSLDVGTTEKLVVNMNGGDDSFSATGNLAALIQITVDGGAGNDTILGSNGVDLLLGGDGNDFIDGQQGNDTAFLGAGDDVFQWDPGDGSDVVEGQDGADTVLFNASGAQESIAISANGGRTQFTRNVGNVAMDLNDVERIHLNALGGADTVTVGNTGGTDLIEVTVDLAGTLGGAAGDAQADKVIVDGTDGGDIIDVFGSGTSVAVAGLSALVNVRNSEGAIDSLVISSLGGNDGISASTLPAGIVKLTIDAGAGNDTITGSAGADVLLGGDGHDFVDGQQGNDTAFLGAGDDVFQWDPGDGSDVIEGQDGTDTLLFFGSGAGENVDISASGGRVHFFRDVANVTMDLNDVERVEFRALGSADNVVVGDLTGTDVNRVDIDLRGPAGGGDGSADSVTANATQGADVFGVAGDAGGITVFGLQAQVDIFNAEQANDRLVLNGLGGDDVIDATSLEADGIRLTVNGGLGDDVILGSEGGDLVSGGDGDDLALLGAGDDTFVWNPGDDNDTVEGQSGFDTLLFNGSNASENIDISANGGRVRFFRDVASVLTDLNDVELIRLNALGGADDIVVDDLSGTDATEIDIDLAAFGGGGDAQPDTVTINGTGNDDLILVVQDQDGILVLGLAATVRVRNFELANDQLIINALGGSDVIEASAVTTYGLTLNGGDGDDVLIGGDGNDTFYDGPGDDVMLGGLGIDAWISGGGVDVFIQ